MKLKLNLMTIMMLFAFNTSLSAQNTAVATGDSDRAVRINNNTVTIVSGNPNGTYLAIAYDISAVLDDGDNLRVLPVIGKGGAQNVRDILYLKGVDMGITQSNVLRYFNKTGEVGRNIEQRLRYIARLYNEELHILVRNDINSLDELKGKKVNFSDLGSGTQVSAKLIFEALGLQVQETNYGQADAFEKLKTGEIAASLLMAGKPAGAYSKIPANSGFKFLPVKYSSELRSDYYPAVLTSEDYPQLIAKDTKIDTIAVGAVLAVFNWQPGSDRYRRVEKFVVSFFENFEKFQKAPRHPKWKESNIAADLPGWTRFGAAQEILDRDKQQAKAAKPKDVNDLRTSFDSYLRQSGQSSADPSKQEEMFRRFLEWQGTQKTR